MKNTQFLPHKAFCLSVVAEMFFGVALFLEVYSALKTGCTLVDHHDWLTNQRKYLGFRPATTFNFSII